MPLMVTLKLASPFGNAPVFFKPESESTMIDARNLSSQGFPSGTVVVADHQTAGRGRFADRKWQAEPGESLLFTVFFKLEDLPSSLGLLPLKTGLALASALEKEFGLKPAVKWPNDVYLGDKKTAGILAEVRGDTIFIGLGINCSQKSFPREIRDRAVSVRIATGRKTVPQDLLPPILSEMKEWLFGRGDWKGELENRLYLKNTLVTFKAGLREGEPQFKGEILGVNDDGRLKIRGLEDGEIRLFAGGEILPEPKRRLFLRA